MFTHILSQMNLPPLSAWAWVGIMLSGVVIGFTKTGIPGLGMVAVTMLAGVLPTKVSVGVMLPMLIFADIFAVVYYRRHAVWARILPLLPWAMAGIVLGSFALKWITDSQLRPIIAVVVLSMLVLNWWQRRTGRMEAAGASLPWILAATLGIIAGFTTMIANAAGPVMTVYLLAMRLPKKEFMGTGAWYFMLMNWAKVPFHVWLTGMITPSSLALSAVCFPAIAIGAGIGVLLIRRLRQETFDRIVEALTALAAVRLFF
jgi:uncharacterized protein